MVTNDNTRHSTNRCPKNAKITKTFFNKAMSAFMKNRKGHNLQKIKQD